jgi:hypothetical protein
MKKYIFDAALQLQHTPTGKNFRQKQIVNCVERLLTSWDGEQRKYNFIAVDYSMRHGY